MINRILFMVSIIGAIVTGSGSAMAFDSAHYGTHKKKLYVPCIYIYDKDGIRYAVNAYFQQLGASKNFRLEDYTRIDNPDENCPEIEFPVQLPVEADEEDEDGESSQPPENDEKDCPNENASDRAKENHPECFN